MHVARYHTAVVKAVACVWEGVLVPEVWWGWDGLHLCYGTRVVFTSVYAGAHPCDGAGRELLFLCGALYVPQENMSLIAELKQLRVDAKSLKQQRAAVKVIADRALARGAMSASAPAPPAITNIDDVIEQQKEELGSLKVRRCRWLERSGVFFAQSTLIVM